MAALTHRRQHRLGQPQRRANVESPAPLEVHRVDALDKVTVEHPGTADEHVDRAERRRHLGHGAPAVGRLREIRRNGVRATAKRRREALEGSAIARNEAHRRARRGELLCARTADAA